MWSPFPTVPQCEKQLTDASLVAQPGFFLSDGIDIDDDKIQLLPSIPNGVGAILNETQAKQNVYLILTGVGPVRNHQQVVTRIGNFDCQNIIFFYFSRLLATLYSQTCTNTYLYFLP